LSNNLLSKIERLEAIVGPAVPPSAWAGYDERLLGAVAAVALRAAGIACHGLPPWPYRSPQPEALAAVEAVSTRMEAMLRESGLMVAELDEGQVARLLEIKAELEDEGHR
jgi:hypothetical protein